MFKKRLSGRSFVILFLCFCILLGVTGRLFFLQVYGHNDYRTKVMDNIMQTTPLSAKRGDILDRNGVALATSRTVYRVFISPRDIRDDAQVDLIAKGLSSLLGLEEEFIRKRAALRYHQDETIKRNVDAETGEKVINFIAENGLSRQVYLEASYQRYYPYATLASHLLGVVGTDGGLTGLEYAYNDYLAGIPGSYIYAKNALGQSLPYKLDDYIYAENGATLVTTIDMTLQSILEKQLYEAYIDTMAQNRVTGIVMNVNTGGILAMGTYPNFDLNSPYTLHDTYQAKLDVYSGENKQAYYTDLLFQSWNNKAISDTYEPGSTFKILTCAMALEEKVASLTDSFSCSGSATWGGRKIRCHKRTGHGSVSFGIGLQQSCNCALMTIADRIGQSKFYDYFLEFGFGEKTGIDLPSEAVSVYHHLSDFHTVELAVYSFGQTFRVTPLQQLTAISAVANGGHLVTPHIVSQILDKDGAILSETETNIKHQVISKETCSTLANILEEGVSGNGGAKNAYVPGYKIAAKTGTSEVRDQLNENGESYLRIGSCVAFAPADDPEIAMIIIVDQPQCQIKYGSVVAAPYVSAFLNEALPYLGFERTYTNTELEKLGVTVGSYLENDPKNAKRAIESLGISCEIIGNGPTVLKQIPAAGQTLEKKNGKVILYTETEISTTETVVPNCVGKTFLEANQMIVKSGLNVKFIGARNYDIGEYVTVVAQSIDAGTSVAQGTVLCITLCHLEDDTTTGGGPHEA